MHSSQTFATPHERQPLLAAQQNIYTPSDQYNHGYLSDSDDGMEETKSLLEHAPTAFSEAVVLVRSSFPLVLAYLLQYSLTLVTIAVTGHLSAVNIAATSVAVMTSNVTGIALYEGFAAGLDTLCAQAYGAGRLDMVGVHVQRMIHLMTLMTIPITLLWVFSPHWLIYMVNDAELAARAGYIMALLAVGNPGYFLFEAGRRFVQAQGLFDAPLYVMLAALPTNVFFTWLFVFRFHWTVAGPALALSVTRLLFPVYLVIYVLAVKPSSLLCWSGIEPFAPKAWVRMIKLAIPGACIVEAEVLIMQFLVVAATYLSVPQAAAQSIMTTIAVVLAHVPIAIGMVVATRLGYLVGSEQLHAARIFMKTAMVFSIFVGIVDAALLIALQGPIIRLFTKDPSVARLSRQAILFLALYQIPGHATGVINGMLRGVGKQARGAAICFLIFLTIGVPISLGFTFGSMQLGLSGLWTGPILAYFVTAIISGNLGLSIDLSKIVQKVRDMV